MSNEQIPSLSENPTKKEILSFICKRYGMIPNFDYSGLSEAYDVIKELQPDFLDRQIVRHTQDIHINGLPVKEVITMLANYTSCENAVVNTDTFEDSISVSYGAIEDDSKYVSRLFFRLRDEARNKKNDIKYEQEKVIRKELAALETRMSFLRKELLKLYKST